MKSINLLVGILVFTLTLTTNVRATEESQEKSLKAAKIDRAQAETIAKERLPDDKMIEGELEREHG